MVEICASFWYDSAAAGSLSSFVSVPAGSLAWFSNMNYSLGYYRCIPFSQFHWGAHVPKNYPCTINGWVYGTSIGLSHFWTAGYEPDYFGTFSPSFGVQQAFFVKDNAHIGLMLGLRGGWSILWTSGTSHFMKIGDDGFGKFGRFFGVLLVGFARR
jgi:hypothetical protein